MCMTSNVVKVFVGLAVDNLTRESGLIFHRAVIEDDEEQAHKFLRGFGGCDTVLMKATLTRDGGMLRLSGELDLRD